MKKIKIAFDVDGTIRDNSRDNSSNPMLDKDKLPVANEEIRSLLVILSKFKNVEITVWSGGGKDYAEKLCRLLGLNKYIDKYNSKFITEEDGMGVRQKNPDFEPDIAIDDIQDCVLGRINLIVKQK